MKTRTTNCGECCNSRLNRDASGSYQKFYSAALWIWKSHRQVMDDYNNQVRYGEYSQSRPQTTIDRWNFNHQTIEEFYDMPLAEQKKHLIHTLKVLGGYESGVVPTLPPIPAEIDPDEDELEEEEIGSVDF